ncbi:hypothetical protein [Parasitella parasitica]|uniref:Reverse transcriptase domain-containing protein n=1 Tax=Parasitella parasitica TaxID=35722 RepID=A0A0B7NCL3_9FUNG|nr:hypothetical protein [Parasitella parasitica]
MQAHIRAFEISRHQDLSLFGRLALISRQQRIGSPAISNGVVSLLQQLGWLVNHKKSVLTPTQQLEHLGFVLDTRKMTAVFPLKKLLDIRRSIKQVLDKPDRQRPRVIHSLTMRIQAATFAVFRAWLYTRHLLYYKNQTVKADTD